MFLKAFKHFLIRGSLETEFKKVPIWELCIAVSKFNVRLREVDKNQEDNLRLKKDLKK